MFDYRTKSIRIVSTTTKKKSREIERVPSRGKGGIEQAICIGSSVTLLCNSDYSTGCNKLAWARRKDHRGGKGGL